MRDEAASVELVSGERIGGGLAADGMGELSKLLLGSQPAKALRLARDTGVLVHLLPEFERAIGFEQESRWHALTVDEHTFEVVQAAADAGFPLRVRLAALFHDLGKPHVAWRGTDGRLHYYAKRGMLGPQSRADQRRARRAGARPASLPDRAAQARRAHRPEPHDRSRARPIRCALGGCSRATARACSFDLLDHKEADLRGKGRPPERRPGEARALPHGRAQGAGEPAPSRAISRSTVTT